MSDQRLQFHDAALKLFQRLSSAEAVRAIDDGASADDLRRGAADAGLDRVLVPAERDGAGGDLTDAIAVLHAAGYHAAPLPLAEDMLARWLAADAGIALDDIAPALAFAAEPGALRDASPAAFSATLARVPWGRGRPVLALVPAATGTRLVLLPAAGEFVAGANLAGEPRDRLIYRDARPIALGTVAPPIEDVKALAALLTAARMVGAMERALDLAIEHANSRVQFGRPIGKFQAIQQMLAEMATHVAASAAAVELGADQPLASFDPLPAAIGKARASEAAGLVCESAHQTVAAMGYTREHPLNLVTRRLWAWREQYGNEIEWNGAVGAAALVAGAGGLWRRLAGD